MRKTIALLLVMAVVMAVFAGCNSDATLSQESTSPLETLQSQTEPPKTETELALEAFISSIDTTKTVFPSLVIEGEGLSVQVTPKSQLEELKNVFSEFAEGSNVYECKDPDIAGIKERLSYKKVVDQESHKDYYWHFFADSSDLDGTVKWIELDPLPNYDGSETPSINGVGLSKTFAEVVEKWGKPDYAGIDLRNGEEVIILRWDYNMGEEDTLVCVYACFTGVNTTNIPGALVHDIYVNTKS